MVTDFVTGGSRRASTVNLADALRRGRAAAGLTQEELAERAGISSRTVSDIERGLRVRIYKDTTGRLVRALGLEGTARAEFEEQARGRGVKPLPTASLPVPPTRLIGRDSELEVLTRALALPEVRIVTITGPGGIGKTRLALEVARFAGEGERALFVELGATIAATEVLPAIAHAAGMLGAEPSTAVSIAGRIGDTRTLVVLDTFEHVLEAGADMAALVAASPSIRLLITTREALRIRGEHEVVLSALELPADTTPEAAMRSPAVCLFAERAQEVQPVFELTEETVPSVVEICRRLGGLPLAIELAAALVKHLEVRDLNQRLGSSFEVLGEGPRDLPARQRTMRDTVAWSYGLLSPELREVFRELCVFSGGWDLDAAAVVCGREVSREHRDLVDKSLIVRGPAQNRFGMLDVIRAYGMELNVPDDAATRHLNHFLKLAEEAETHIGGAGQETWLSRLEAEHDNLRAAIRRTLARHDGETALRLTGALWRFWMLRGHMGEGRGWLHAAMAAGSTDARLRARALWGLSWLAYHQGDYVETANCGDEMVRLHTETQDPVHLRNALTAQGVVALAKGEFAETIELFTRGVELLRNGSDSWLLATALLNLGMAAAHAGDSRAEAVLNEARDLYLACGDRIYESRAVLYLGYAALVQGRPEAEALFRESLTTFWELDDLWGVAEGIEGLAACAAAAQSAERAAMLAGAAGSIREGISTRALPADGALLTQRLDEVATSVPAARWRQLVEEGGAMSPDEAADYALRR